MTLHPIPAFNDNYIWALHISQNSAILVDPGEAAPALDYLATQGLSLAAILITHHHGDHIGGVAELLSHHPAPIYGKPWPGQSEVISPATDEDFFVPGLERPLRLLDIPGHTSDHVAFFLPAQADMPPLLFCGDTLFAAGCGRLFGLPPALMHASLHRLSTLPPETLVCCAHEYTLSNLAFARHWLPLDSALKAREQKVKALREQGRPSLPSTLAEELATNPFLRTHDATLRQALSSATEKPLDSSLDVFTLLRRLKDDF